MVYTLGEAARATGKAKSAISQAIAAGRLSAKKDEFGGWQIEPAELHRVYPAQNPKPNGSDQEMNTSLRAENERLKLQVEMLERNVGSAPIWTASSSSVRSRRCPRWDLNRGRNV